LKDDIKSKQKITIVKYIVYINCTPIRVGVVGENMFLKICVYILYLDSIYIFIYQNIYGGLEIMQKMTVMEATI
jgi:hypothetical protein